MNYYLVMGLIWLATTLIALWLTTPVKPPRRWTLGDCKESKLDSKHRTYCEPLS